MNQSLQARLAPSWICDIAPYRAGRPIAEVARAYGLDPAQIVKLASNENPLGMPDSARQAAIQALGEASRYPDANGYDLKQALAHRGSVPEAWITLGNGSNDILELVGRALLQQGASVVYSQYSFQVYELVTQAMGARAIVVPAVDFGHDLNAMRAAIAPDTRLVFIANPNNPTGTFLRSDALRAFLMDVPEHVVVVLDEAYNEYLEGGLQADALAWVHEFPRLVVSRTFSKAYGLAGLRVGYAVAQAPLTDLLNRVRQPFNVGNVAQAAAVAALSDHGFIDRSRALNAQGLAQLTSAFQELGLVYVPSFGNFILLHVGDALSVNERLLRAGVIVRPVANYGLPEYLRVSVGLPRENATFIKALRHALEPA
jgi:histidinol-phosphate aminotransferase